MSFQTPRIPGLGLQLRIYNNDGLSFYLGRKGKSGAEDCAELRLKSDTLLIHTGEDNEADFVLRPDGSKCFGKKDAIGNTVTAKVMRAIELQKELKLAQQAAGGNVLDVDAVAVKPEFPVAC